MITAFVSAVREYVRGGGHRQKVLCAYENRESDLWYFEPLWQSHLDYLCIVHEDGSAQLLSRDEDECRLFATLWELEK